MIMLDEFCVLHLSSSLGTFRAVKCQIDHVDISVLHLYDSARVLQGGWPHQQLGAGWRPLVFLVPLQLLLDTRQWWLEVRQMSQSRLFL